MLLCLPDCFLFRLRFPFYLFFQRVVTHDREESKSYFNNEYSLIESVQNREGVTFDYKGRNGERQKSLVTFEQLFSIAEYLIRAGQFVGNDRLERFEKDWESIALETKSPVEQDFANALLALQKEAVKGNFRFEAMELPKAGQKTRYGWNIEAIRLMKQIEYEDRAATPDEQKIWSYVKI